MTSPTGDPQTAVIIEDDPEIRQILAEVLESVGFSTVSVGNGIDGVQAVLTYKPLLTTLDVNMPGIDGFEAAKRIRAQSDTYIIMLTGLTEEADVVAGLGAGADDYLLKPFRPRELRARIDAAMRRARPGAATASTTAPPQGDVGPSIPDAGQATTRVSGSAPGAPAPDAHVAGEASGPALDRSTAETPTAGATAATGAAASVTGHAGTNDGDAGEWLEHRGLRLHPENRIVTMNGDELDLTRTEFDLLATLLESKRRVRSKADLTLALRGESYVTSYYVGDADKRAVEAHMTNLRRKLGESAAHPVYIETVRGVGYRLTSETA
ncbi:response regulator transcription factor [Microbacterium sp. CFH 90308]|uniref:Response regulator transcription factor n=1 Tax=Microbacterium salsuginis TaxID=2722803 RepID=A0ABX1KBD9_9MICO|nr:response regulator transcription factor [Microbacterium sp. CFH 90308]NLP84343.1 response regulator transcription factor [Microbacterium sp. CFH 90308]